MKKILIFLLFSIIIFNSCKKDSNNPANTDTVPSPPTLLSPTGGTNVGIPPTLSWKSSAANLSYTLQVAKNSSFDNLVYNQTELTSSSQEIYNLSSFTIYYWRVNATNQYGSSGWSEIWRFTTSGPLPDIPVLSLPANGATGILTSQTMIWNSSSGADNYTLQVSTDGSFISFVFNQSGLKNTNQQISGFSLNTKYYWRVSATNSYGNSKWSEIRIFTTTSVDDVDNRIMPQSNISFTNDLQPVFQLKCSNAGCHDDGTRAGGLSLTSCVNAKSDPGAIAPYSSKTSRLVWAEEGQAGIQPMPPVGVNKPFTSEQDRGLKKWIDEGAKCN